MYPYNAKNNYPQIAMKRELNDDEQYYYLI